MPFTLNAVLHDQLTVHHVQKEGSFPAHYSYLLDLAGWSSTEPSDAARLALDAPRSDFRPSSTGLLRAEHGVMVLRDVQRRHVLQCAGGGAVRRMCKVVPFLRIQSLHPDRRTFYRYEGRHTQSEEARYWRVECVRSLSCRSPCSKDCQKMQRCSQSLQKLSKHVMQYHVWPVDDILRGVCCSVVRSLTLAVARESDKA